MPEIKSSYYIAHVGNLCSIFDQYILSHNGVKARDVEYKAIYDPEIVENRKLKLTPSGHSLWDFANLYFQPCNPMLYRVVHNQCLKDNIVVQGLQPRILELPGAYITDGNAENTATDFYTHRLPPVSRPERSMRWSRPVVHLVFHSLPKC
jgi:hypothetical protein